MNKYIGKYRVVAERDTSGVPNEFSYIRCANDGKIYRYSGDTLVYYVPLTHKGKYIERECQKYIEKVMIYDYESEIFFKEEHLDVLSKIFRIHTKGKDIKPKNKYKSRKVEAK